MSRWKGLEEIQTNEEVDNSPIPKSKDSNEENGVVEMFLDTGVKKSKYCNIAYLLWTFRLLW